MTRRKMTSWVGESGAEGSASISESERWCQKCLCVVCVSEALTQVEAARQLGTNQQYINRCEAGDRRIDFIEVADVAALYRRPLE